MVMKQVKTWVSGYNGTGVIPGDAVGALASPDFGRSVKTLSLPGGLLLTLT